MNEGRRELVWHGESPRSKGPKLWPDGRVTLLMREEKEFWLTFKDEAEWKEWNRK